MPILPSKRREDWNIADPTGKPDDAFISVIRTIEAKIIALKSELENQPTGKHAAAD